MTGDAVCKARIIDHLRDRFTTREVPEYQGLKWQVIATDPLPRPVPFEHPVRHGDGAAQETGQPFLKLLATFFPPKRTPPKEQQQKLFFDGGVRS